MAYNKGVKYTPSALVSEFSGKQGSTVASRNRYGPYMRNRVIPVNTNTAIQINARNNFKAIAIAWRGLTDAQRAAWRSAATSVVLIDRLGRPYNPSGLQYFASINRTVYVYNPAAALVTALPAQAAPAALLTIAATADTGTTSMAVVYTATPVAANTKVLIEATKCISPGINFVKPSLYRQILVSAAAAASPANPYAAYVAKYGLLIATKKIGVRATVITADGQRSAPITQLIVVT